MTEKKTEVVKVSKAALNRIIRQNTELKKDVELLIKRQKDIGTFLYHLFVQKQKLCEEDQSTEVSKEGTKEATEVAKEGIKSKASGQAEAV